MKAELELPPELAALADGDSLVFRQALAQALDKLAGQILAGDAGVEAVFTAVFHHLANRLFADDTAGLLALVARVGELPLRTAAARQQRLYFQAVAYFKQDQYEAALRAFDELLGQPGLDDYLRARALNARAVVCRVTGQLEAAMAGYRASLALWEALGDAHYQGIVRMNLGIIAYELRDYAGAEAHLRQAAEHFRAAGSGGWLATVQNEMGLVLRDQGRWDEALAAFAAFIAQRRDESDEDVGIGLANQGEVLLFKGDLAGAKAALQEARRRIVSQTYQCDHLLYLGLAEQAEGDLAAAQGYFAAALDLAQRIERREILPHAYYHLGDVLRRRGDDAGARAMWVRATAVIQATRTPLRDEALKISLLGRWQQVYEALVLHCLARGRPAAAFAWAERARARAFAEAVAPGVETSLPDVETSLWSVETSLWSVETSLWSVETSLSDAETSLSEGESLLWEEEAGLRLVQSLRLDQSVVLLSYFTTGVLEQDVPLLRAIPADNPLRAHLLLPARTLLFVVTRERLTAVLCPIDPNLFATQSPRGFEARRFLQTAVLERLRRDLLVPAALAARRVVVAPHGPLHRVPFAALLHAEGGPLLTLAPSAAIYAARRAAAAGQGCLAVGYDGDGRLQLAAAEAALVAGRLGGQVWVGAEAKKARLREAAGAYRWLHIACHGWFDEADPLASYLETGAGERLTAREILHEWRLAAELVTLSACETGVSQILRGDEPMGLVRALLAVGARAVLVTQWPVDDVATFLLMGRFYELIQAQESVDLAAALHRAQAWLQALTWAEAQTILDQYAITLPEDWGQRAAGERPFAGPVYWAGFVIVNG
ncbi:MAG: CHAT domain-containing protein [Ardenticatenaceae bacterium]|nr:CHAT domain-containing protein [Ardenticatenaceae bacterium]